MILMYLAHSSGEYCGSPHRQSLNRKFANNGTNVEKIRETVNKAIEITLDVSVDGVHTPRAYLLRAASTLLSCAPDRDWDLDEEMRRWGLGENPLLPLIEKGVMLLETCQVKTGTLGQVFRQYDLVPYLLWNGVRRLVGKGQHRTSLHTPCAMHMLKY